MTTTSGAAGSRPAGPDVVRLQGILGADIDLELLQLALTQIYKIEKNKN